MQHPTGEPVGHRAADGRYPGGRRVNDDGGSEPWFNGRWTGGGGEETSVFHKILVLK